MATSDWKLRPVRKNTIFGMISGADAGEARLPTMPIVIAHRGLGGYGIWAIIMTTAAYMRFGAIGVKSAFQKYVAEANGSGDYLTASKLLSTGCAAMFLLSVALLIPVSIFSGTLARLAGVPPQFMKQASAAISVLALIMVMSNVGAVFEAIMMGGHRIDVARRFNTGFSIVEAMAIVARLHYGHGLLAMASVTGISELGFVICCFFTSRKVVPQIHAWARYLTAKVLPELFRFAGSYQLVNLLQVFYAAILPIAILRAFGADYGGMYALSARLISPAQRCCRIRSCSPSFPVARWFSLPVRPKQRGIAAQFLSGSWYSPWCPWPSLAYLGTPIVFA